MKSNLSTTILKLIVFAIAGTILALAAFGIGVSVGAAAKPTALPLQEAAAPAACAPTPLTADDLTPDAELPASYSDACRSQNGTLGRQEFLRGPAGYSSLQRSLESA